ncbi:uncharacterized protein BT62DRAFT_1010741 [Guyanagaster necrorhizus]|uniref:Uncharacterized protein n=1 Tax=Guyanagaster necrorhizus TaxID=856835 RepID=A0A9P8ANT6_9AGAR|nr:uncharacterized protein BT62DRAFT_1010741 [Guyanagaster necrorhizus MCA 3950]KAG7442204.1 hypothetical protein BT62DRAFT_1010741 [Guyanagaster necrorhizus MCA 3950]
MSTFPPELVEIVVYEAWHSDMPSSIRTRFMTTCPLVNRTWKAVYAPIASQDIYITNLAYIYYLCKIARLRTSIIYHDFIPRLSRTITCFVHLGDRTKEAAVKRVYDCLINLPNDVGFKNLFPLVPYISFELGWISYGQKLQSCGIPIYIRVYFHRYLSINKDACYEVERRVDFGISMTDSDPLRRVDPLTRTDIEKLRKIYVIGGVPWFLFTVTLKADRWMTLDGIRAFRRTIEIYPHRGDIKDINWRLWMASKGRRSTWVEPLLSAWI